MPVRFVPMSHPVTGGRTMAPESAVANKQKRGWVLDDQPTNVPDNRPDEPAPAPELYEQEPAQPAEPEHEE